MTAPGELYDTGVGTVGGRGQQATMPHPTPQHVITITRITTDTYLDFHVTAAEAIRQRIERFKENKMPYEQTGNILTYTDNGGAVVTLAYQDPS